MAKTSKKKATRTKTGPDKSPQSSEQSVRTRDTGTSRSGSGLAQLRDIERLFDDFLERHWGRPMRWEWPTLRGIPSLLEQRVPSVDIVDREKEIVVRAEVPGIDKKDLDVSIAERTLTIKGSQRHEEKTEEDDYYRQEIRSGTFSRSVLLPSDVDTANAKASFKDGIVELHLPKLHATKRRKIAVS